MSDLADKKPVSTLEVVPMMSKIMEDKQTGPNYLDWSKTIHFYLRSLRMASHLNKDPPTDDSKEQWLEDDACLFLQIRNSIDGKIRTLINQCKFVKELVDCLEFVYSRNGNLLTYLMCVEPFISLRNKIGRLKNFSWTIKRHMRN